LSGISDGSWINAQGERAEPDMRMALWNSTPGTRTLIRAIDEVTPELNTFVDFIH
jgi:hypothetical protein